MDTQVHLHSPIDTSTHRCWCTHTHSDLQMLLQAPHTHTGLFAHTMHFSCISEMSSVSTMCAVCAAWLFFTWRSYPIPWHAFCLDDGELFSWRRRSHPFSSASALYTHSSQGQGVPLRRDGLCVWAVKKNAARPASNERLWSARIIQTSDRASRLSAPRTTPLTAAASGCDLWTPEFKTVKAEKEPCGDLAGNSR